MLTPNATPNNFEAMNRLARRSIFRVLALSVVLAAALGVFTLRSHAGRSEAAVNRLQYSLGCGPGGSAQVAFYWYGGSQTAVQTWIDLSIYGNFFQPGTFIGAGSFKASDGYFEWRGMLPNTTHYVRINQQLANGSWDPSETY